ncbi:hypothetical protein GB937_003263 [Aspergillus fischeri]|nr:hypothetical protein GB937_003263 [Aspergillus fischeri]
MHQLPTSCDADSILVVTCELLVEMLQCVSRRLHLVHVVCLQGMSLLGKQTVPERHVGLRSFVLRLSGGYTLRTSGIFADAGQTRYSYEEQVPIIREFCGCSYGNVAPCSSSGRRDADRGKRDPAS